MAGHAARPAALGCVLHFAAFNGEPEELQHSRYFQDLAGQAGITVRFVPIPQIGWDRADIPGDAIAKPILAREGANMELVRTGRETVRTGGSYGNAPVVYQEVAPLPVFDGQHVVVGSGSSATRPPASWCGKAWRARRHGTHRGQHQPRGAALVRA